MDFKYDFEKSVYWSIESINNIHSEKAFKVSLENYPLHDCTAITKKEEGKDFECKFLLNKLYGQKYLDDAGEFGLYNKIELIRSGESHIINPDSISHSTVTISNPQIINSVTTNFQTHDNDFFNNKLLRLCIITDVEPEFSSFESKVLKINETTTFSGLVEVRIGNKDYHIFKSKNEYNNRKFIFIDSVEENTFSEFKTNTKAILLAFAIVTGNLFQDEIYYQVIHHDNITMADATAYYKTEKSIYTRYSLFNPFRFSEYIKDLKYPLPENFPLLLPKQIFENLCEKISNNTAFARCCLLTLEGNESKFSLLKASIYSLALETITNIIYDENKSKLNPIPDKKLFDKIKAKLILTVNEYESFLSEYALNILKAKFNDLNKPTNSKKLSFPFEFYGLKLSESDIKILNHRNKFLHGTSPFKETEIEEKSNELDYIIAKLLFMVYSLIMKHVGYRGHIINFPSWLQYNRKQDVTEHFFYLI
ncbi:hypothetical protein GCM10027594_05100 [Hymenobacter agri]